MRSLANTFGMLSGDLYGTGKRRREAKLEDLKLFQGLEIDEFLELLNRKATPQKPLLPPEPGDLPRMSYSPLPTTQEILRGWVDEWLDSGRDKDGQEDPRERSFDKARDSAQAAHEYSKLGKLHLIPYKDRLVLSPDEYDPKRRIVRSLIGIPPENYAKEKLTLFLLSELRNKLAKCHKCGQYFVLRHWNRLYKRGTLCDSCKRSRSEESAIKATAEVRDHAKAQLYDFAAKKFAKQIDSTPDWHRQKTLKNAIAKFLSAKIERSESLRAVYKSGVTGKWVSRSENWNAIDTAAKGEK